MRRLWVWGASAAILMASTGNLEAMDPQGHGPGQPEGGAAAAAGGGREGAGNYLGAAVMIGLAFAAAFGALGQSRAISASVEAVARQPEAGGRIFMSMIIGLALIETLVIYTLILALLMMEKV